MGKERASARFDRVRIQAARRSRFEHAGTLEAWQHAEGTERPRRLLAASIGSYNEVEDAEDILRDARGATHGDRVQCDVQRMRHYSCTERYPSLLLGGIGRDRPATATSWEVVTDTCRVGRHRFELECARGTFVEQPTTTAGNRWRRWCIQPIGY